MSLFRFWKNMLTDDFEESQRILREEFYIVLIPPIGIGSALIAWSPMWLALTFAILIVIHSMLIIDFARTAWKSKLQEEEGKRRILEGWNRQQQDSFDWRYQSKEAETETLRRERDMWRRQYESLRQQYDRMFNAQGAGQRQYRTHQEQRQQRTTNATTDRLRNHYTTLGIAPTLDLKEIKKAFRQLSKIHHPDMGGDAGRFQRIKEAYDEIQKAIKVATN